MKEYLNVGSIKRKPPNFWWKLHQISACDIIVCILFQILRFIWSFHSWK